MRSVLEEIVTLRNGKTPVIDHRNSNRYCIVAAEANGTKTAYCFGVPIYNNRSKRLVNYLQLRYFDPSVGRFINADEIVNLGAGSSIRCFNVFVYAENHPISMIDEDGRAAINIICAAIGAVVGWFFGDWVAKKLGYYSGWKYWAIRAGVVIGGAVIGWFAGTLIAKLIATYLKCNPGTVFRISSRLGAKGFKTAMEFLGINPFTLAMDASKFIAIARLFNTTSVTLSYNWVVKLYDIVKRFGYRIALDYPHGGYSWHIHLSGGNGRLINLHIQIVKAAWDWLKRILG